MWPVADGHRRQHGEVFNPLDGLQQRGRALSHRTIIESLNGYAILCGHSVCAFSRVNDRAVPNGENVFVGLELLV